MFKKIAVISDILVGNEVKKQGRCYTIVMYGLFENKDS
jgi:hypothetical protein